MTAAYIEYCGERSGAVAEQSDLGEPRVWKSRTGDRRQSQITPTSMRIRTTVRGTPSNHSTSGIVFPSSLDKPVANVLVVTGSENPATTVRERSPDAPTGEGVSFQDDPYAQPSSARRNAAGGVFRRGADLFDANGKGYRLADPRGRRERSNTNDVTCEGGRVRRIIEVNDACQPSVDDLETAPSLLDDREAAAL